MRVVLIFIFAIVICRLGSDAFFFFKLASSIMKAISLYKAAQRHKEVTGKLDNIQTGINSHRQETALGFRQVNLALVNINDYIYKGRVEAHQNFKQTTAQLNKLQASIDNNHREVQLSFAQSFDMLYYIGSNLNMVSTSVNSILDLVSSQKENDPHLGPDLVLVNDNIRKLNDYIAKIDYFYDNFLHYSEDTSGFNNKTLLDYATASLSHDGDSPMGLLKAIHNLFNRPDGLINSFSHKGVAKYVVCSKSRPPRQLLYSLFEMAVLAELKALTLMSFSHNLNGYFGEGLFTKEQNKEIESCRIRLNSLGSSVARALKKSSSYFWRCDSPTEGIGNEYIQFTNFIQGTVASTFSPGAKCSDTLYQSLPCGNDIPKEYGCKGKIYDCISSDARLESVCLDEAPRRYKTVKLAWGKTFGQQASCVNQITLDKSCGYCLCYCDANESPEKDRYISLAAAVSNVEDGMVVTGVRFRKYYDVLHLQVQEASVGPLGLINSSTARWVPLGNDLKKFELTIEKKAINIDIFDGEIGKVLTGVRFRSVSHGVTLEVELTPYNPETGVLDKSKKSWTGNENRKDYRQKIDIENVKPPTAAHVVPEVQSSTNQYIEITTTGMVEDLAQTVVPFFDSRNVTPYTLIPLSGFGLQYKSADKKYGGFITPVLVSLDYADNVGKEIPAEKLEPIDSANIKRRTVTSLAMSWTPSFYVLAIASVLTLHY